jgi:hypothetical protein
VSDETKCPKCGAQVKDPFSGKITIHDVELCTGSRPQSRPVIPNTCPHCGSEPIYVSGYPTPSGKAILKQRACGSVISFLYPENEQRSELCREREAHNKTKEQLKDARGWLDERYAALTEADAHSEHLEAEKQKLCRIARRALEITKTWNANYAEVEELEKKLEAIEGSIGEASSE